MFGNFFQSRSRGRASGPASGPGGSPSANSSHLPTFPSPDLHRPVASDVQSEEPPFVTVTSDLPEYGGSPSPQRDNAEKPDGIQSPRLRDGSDLQSTILTPGRARLEVVLNPSPQRPRPGYQLFKEADLDNEDEPASADACAPKKRKVGPGDPSNLPAAAAAAAAATTPHHQAESMATPQAQTAGPRPRGRPKGWRPGMPSYKTPKPKAATAARQLDGHGNPIAAPPKSTGQKRRGRPPRLPPPTARMVWERMDAPTYVPFLCEWSRCKAELQNVETLRRHVRKLHGGSGKNGEGIVCRWGKCGQHQVAPGEETVFTGKEFNEHMETRHLIPLVWHVGDGVRNSKCLNSVQTAEEEGDKIPSYLLGPDGKQVTPWVKYQGPEDNATLIKNRSRLRAILLQRDENAPLAEEDEMQ